MAKFEPGHAKLPNSGRKKGVTNKWHPPDVRQVLSEDKIDPVRSILALLPELSPDKRLDAWKFLISTAFPKITFEVPISPARDVSTPEAKQIPPAELLEQLSTAPDDEEPDEGE